MSQEQTTDDLSNIDSYIETCDSKPCVGYEDIESCKICYERAKEATR